VLDPDRQRELVARAAEGDQRAWDDLVDAFAGLVWSICRGHGMYGADAADVFQTVWLRAVEHLARLRDAERLGAWLATTARHECYRQTRRSARTRPVGDVPDTGVPDSTEDTAQALDDRVAMRAYIAALEQVGEGCRVLLRMLATDPPPSYDEIAAALDMPRGSIGPTRQRCLEKMRRLMEAPA
jgi:RNA polymerase sigma factor (sigma-70 family)